MAPQLSWDLHVHPGPSSLPRWGSGAAIQEAARRAGVRGFVWKSHEGHTARPARQLPAGPPHVIGSASLNPWASPTDVWQALADGARWVWGPTRLPGLRLAWDLDLPAWWPDLLDGLPASTMPLLFATGHLGWRGRRAMAEAAAQRGDVCSITHALFVPPDELDQLVELGCRFEVDLYTAEHALPGRPPVSLADGLARLLDAGASVYVTSDAGQLEVGDPYVFSARVLARLAEQLGADRVDHVATIAPATIARTMGLGQS